MPHNGEGQEGEPGKKGFPGEGKQGGKGGEGGRGGSGGVGGAGGKGETGATGATGPVNPLSTKLKYALILWIIIFTALVAWSTVTTRNNTNDNKNLIVKLEKTSIKVHDLRILVEAGCKNYEVLRAAVNDFNGTLDQFLLAAENARFANYKHSHQKADLVAARAYRKFRMHTRQVSATCIKPSTRKTQSNGKHK